MKRALGSVLLLVAVGLLGARPAAADTTIHAVGRVVYENPRGELVGADGISVGIWEEAYGVDLCPSRTREAMSPTRTATSTSPSCTPGFLLRPGSRHPAQGRPLAPWFPDRDHPQLCRRHD